MIKLELNNCVSKKVTLKLEIWITVMVIFFLMHVLFALFRSFQRQLK